MSGSLLSTFLQLFCLCFLIKKKKTDNLQIVLTVSVLTKKINSFTFMLLIYIFDFISTILFSSNHFSYSLASFPLSVFARLMDQLFNWIWGGGEGLWYIG